MKALPNTSFLPVPKSAPAGHTTAAAHLLWQVFPRYPCLEYKDNSGQSCPVRYTWTASFGCGLMFWQKWFNLTPQFVAYQFPGHLLHPHWYFTAYSSICQVLLGALSYLTPDRTKPITARKLGDDFERAAVLAVLEQNAARTAEKAAAISSTPPSIKDQLRADRAARTAPNVQRLVDIEQKKAEGKGRGYERWATMHNLKQMAATLNVYQEYGFTSPEQLEAAVDTAYQEMRQTSGELKALETKLQGKKELQRQVLAYAKTKPVRDGLKAQKSPKAREAYRQAHESDFIIADAAARYFKAHGITRLPARKALQDEIEQLVSKKSGLYNTYHEQKQRFKELQTVKRNIDQILRREEPRRRKEQSHER